ncbi:hypothetical protein ACIRPU_40780 [Streptomyces sp. NPDC102259]|uniref:hypothetical protein n=1 Tax=Streptomyces sp. NPDC102259 TaxID=3366148 RepID=UPI0037F80744
MQIYEQLDLLLLYGQFPVGSGLDRFYQQRGFTPLAPQEKLDLEPLSLPAVRHRSRARRAALRPLEALTGRQPARGRDGARPTRQSGCGRWAKRGKQRCRPRVGSVERGMPSSRSRRRAPRPPVVTRSHAPLTGKFAADPTVCHHAYQVAVDFGFVAVDAIADLLPQEESLALAKRMGFCDCGRLALDDTDLTRSALSAVAAANVTACQGLVLAAIDYAHRTFGCAGLSALVHELTDGQRATYRALGRGSLPASRAPLSGLPGRSSITR